MKQKQGKSQLQSLFLRNVLAFSLIFLVLGLMILRIFQQSLYEKTDSDLTQLSQNEQQLTQEFSFAFSGKTSKKPSTTTPFANAAHPQSFNVSILIWTKNGKTLVNQTSIGARSYDLKKLKVKRSALGEIQNVTYGSGEKAQHFRAIVRKVTYNNQTYYVQYISNTNQVYDTMNQVQVMLYVALGCFWAISIGVSYWLARRSMRTILESWQKQQEFVENASHELRTPLTIIQTQLELLFTTPKKTVLDVSEKIGHSLAETKRLTTLTQDLLLLARSDSQQIVLKFEDVEVTQFLKQTLEPYQEYAELSDKQFQVSSPQAFTARFDLEKMRQVLIILVDNALKYTREQEKITVEAIEEDKFWRLRVTDTGKGIALEDQKQVFERFYRADKSRNRDSGGYGLGLAIADKIVEMHTGSISVHDNFPKGTVFEVKLPKKEQKKA